MTVFITTVVINVRRLLCNMPVIFLSGFDFWQFLVKPSNLKFYENLYSNSQVVPCRQIGEQEEREADTHNETNSCLL
jgi:hypothetical protein